MVFALSLAPLTAAVGGAVDFGRAATIAGEVQSALDSGALAAALLTQARDPETVVRAYLAAAIGDHAGLVEQMNVEVRSEQSLNAREVTATASVSLPTVFLGLIGVESLDIRRTATALEQVRNVEISLVLDISGSMRGSKIRSLHSAGLEFIETVLYEEKQDRTSVSVIPYNGGVRIPGRILRDFTEPGLQRYVRPGQTTCPDHGRDHPVEIELSSGSLGLIDRQGQRGAYCPPEHARSIFHTNNRGRLNGLINTLRNSAGGNTGLDVATAWGVRALDPYWRGRLDADFRGRPVDYSDTDTMKVMVVMTDGAATAQRRRDGRRWRTIYNAREARRNFSEVCEYAKDRGIVVYTIAFQVSGSRNRDLMRDCATDAAHYYEVESTDISAAFAAIAADIDQLRISR